MDSATQMVALQGFKAWRWSMQLKIKRRFNAYSHIFQKKILEELKKMTEGPKIVIKEKKEHEQDYDDLALTLNRDPEPKKILH